jgi:hypothetical protein
MRRRQSYSEEDWDRLVQFRDMLFNTLISTVIAQDGTYRSIGRGRGEEKEAHVKIFRS